MTRSQRDAFCGSPTTLYQRAASILGPLLVAGAAVYLLLVWKTIPDTIPTSFDMAGNPNAWDSKVTLWSTPVIGFFVILTMSLAGLFPRSWNTGIRITEANKVLVYRAIRDFLATLQITMGVFFAAFTVYTAQVPDKMGPVILISIFALFFAPIIWLVIRFIRIKRLVG